MAICPICKNTTDYFNKVETTILKDNEGSWSIQVGATEVFCPYCKCELNEDDIDILGIPSGLILS